MRFVVDANVPRSLTIWLRESGHDVLDVTEWDPDSQDQDIIDLAKAQRRVLITADLEFGNIRKHPIASHQGIVLIRPKGLRPEELLLLVQRTILELGEDLSGKLVILDRNQMRIRET